MSRSIAPVKGSAFTIARVAKATAEVRSDDDAIVASPAKPRMVILGNVGTTTRTVKGHAVTSTVKSGTVAVPRGDLLRLFEEAGTPEMADRFPESGEPTVPSDREAAALFAAWLADQSSLTIGDADAAALADL